MWPSFSLFAAVLPDTHTLPLGTNSTRFLRKDLIYFIAIHKQISCIFYPFKISQKRAFMNEIEENCKFISGPINKGHFEICP